MNLRKRLFLSSFLFLIAFLATQDACATSISWTGNAGTSDWFTASNWNPETVPTTADVAYINGASVEVSVTGATSGAFYVGDTADASLLLAEDSSFYSSSNVYFSWGADSTLTMEPGATFEIAVSLTVASSSDDVVHMYLSGAGTTLTIGDYLWLGRYGDAYLTASDGAQISIVEQVVIGQQAGSHGEIILTGEGTSLSADNYISVGRDGTGSLSVLDGADVVSSGIISIGRSTVDAVGTVTVSGAGSTLTSTSGALTVGAYGTGYLYVLDGGVASSGEQLVVAQQEDAKGTVLLSGSGSKIISGEHAHIANKGTATMSVLDGGYLFVTGWMNIATAATANGTLIISGSDSLVEVGEYIYIGSSGAGTLTVSDGGSITAVNEITIARYASSSGILNIGSASGETPTAPGYISASSIEFRNGTGTLVFNHTSTNYTFSLAMSSSGSGTSSILVESGFTTLTADSSGFTGTTTVSGGTLSVNGSLGGTITVTSGGRLQGTGTMSTVVIESGGVFAPGNSVGTTTVASLTLESGSSLEIEIDGTGSDVINVTGTLTNNGGDVVITMDEGVSLSTSSSYNYLTYASLSGSAVSVTVEDSLPFLSTTAFSTGTTTSVAFSRNATSFASLASTDNQLKVASVLSGLSSGDLYQGLISVKNADLARAAYDQLSGALHANVKLSLLADNKDEIFASRLEEAPSPYVQALGKWTRRDGHSQTAGFSGSSRGILIGQERQIDKDKIFGFAVHYQKANYEEEANLYADATVKSYGASLYGQMPYKYKTQLKAGLSYSYHDIESHREISISGYTDNPTGDYEAHKLETFIEAAKPYSWGDKGNIEPYGRVNLSYITIPGFKESGGEAALDMQQSKDAMGKTAIGLRFKGELPFEKNKKNRAIFKAHLGWEHIVGDLTTSSTGHLAALQDASISAAPLARDSVALGAQMQLHYGQSLNLGLRYAGTLAASSASHAVMGALAYKF